MHQILAFITFLFRSTNHHGVHSPFVYGLLTKCIYNKEKKDGFKIIEDYRNSILKDFRIIQVKDFGAGSRVFKSNKRKVSAIAKNAGISKKRALLLNKLTSYLNIRSALELGTSVGISSAAIAAGNKVQLTTLEGCPETAAVAKEYSERFGLGNIDVLVGEFESPPTPKGGVKSKSGVLEKYINKTLSTLRPFDTSPTEGMVESGEKGVEPARRGGSGACPPWREWKVERQDVEYTPTTDNQLLTTDNRELSTKKSPPRPAGTPPDEGMDLQPKFEDQQLSTNNDHQTQNPKPPTPSNQQLTTHNSQLTTDLIFFDGNHQKEATLKYFHQLLPLAHNDSVFIFDDIHWSKGMEEAWEEIKEHSEVRVTIDTFFWGMIFFRKEQKKEHFVIRM